MKLDFFKNLTNSFKENKSTQNFINELGDYLKRERTEKILNEEGILEQIQEQRKTSIVSRNTMRDKMSQILKCYAKKKFLNSNMYFIVSQKDDMYTAFKYENNMETVEKISKEKLPKQTRINSILTIKNGGFVLCAEDSKDVINQISQMADSVLNRQEKELTEFRKEGHLYMVEEDRKGRIYLTDLTDKTSNIVLEEVDFPEDLLNKDTEGAVFQYYNGSYHQYTE